MTNQIIISDNRLEQALKYAELGFSVIPVGKNKKCLLTEWKIYQTEIGRFEESCV